jgi:hypothetical protein
MAKRRSKLPNYYRRAVPLVPNLADPDAPYGRDDNHEPIRPLPSEEQRQAEWIEKLKNRPPSVVTAEELFRQQEAERNRKIAQQESEKPVKAVLSKPAAEDEPPSPEEIQRKQREALLAANKNLFLPKEKVVHPSEDSLEYELGYSGPRDWDRPYICLRDLLGLSREQILAWFDVVIAEKYVDLPPEPLPPVDKELLNKIVADCRKAIEDIETEIKNRSVKVRGKELLKDGSPNPSYLDDEARRRLNREDRAKIKKLEKQIQERKNEKERKVPAPKSAPAAEGYIESIVRKRDFLFSDVLVHHKEWMVTYGDVVNLQVAATHEVDVIENKVIQLALAVLPKSICPRPSDEMLEKYPWIKLKSLEGFDRVGRDYDNEAELENKYILKTGGGSIGARISAAGWRWIPKDKSGGHFTRRGLHNFNPGAPIGAGGEEGNEPECDDQESYQPD